MPRFAPRADRNRVAAHSRRATLRIVQTPATESHRKTCDRRLRTVFIREFGSLPFVAIHGSSDITCSGTILRNPRWWSIFRADCKSTTEGEKPCSRSRRDRFGASASPPRSPAGCAPRRRSRPGLGKLKRPPPIDVLAAGAHSGARFSSAPSDAPQAPSAGGSAAGSADPADGPSASGQTGTTDPRDGSPTTGSSPASGDSSASGAADSPENDGQMGTPPPRGRYLASRRHRLGNYS